MKKRTLHILLPALLATVLFLGCGHKPGEKLYREALAEQEQGHLIRARSLLEKSIRRRAGSVKNADAYNRLGILLREMGEFDSAADAFSESLRIDTEQYDVLCNLGIALSAQGSFEEAERIFREAALTRPDDHRPNAFAGTAYVQKKRWPEAQRNLSRALKNNQQSPSLQNAMALTELYTEGAEPALNRLQAVIHNNPGYLPALFNTASIYYHWLQKPADAKRWYESYLTQAPDDAPFKKQAQNKLKQISEGSVSQPLAIQPVKTIDRSKAEPIFKQALILHKAGNLSEAITSYTAALELDNTYTQAFYNLGLAYYANNQMKLAGEAFAQAVELNPAFTSARYNHALTAYHTGNHALVRRELNQVLALQPDYQPAIDLLARLGTK